MSTPLETLRDLPRTPLATLPTSLQEAPDLRAAVRPDGPRLWLKRDDETGFALGGNKVRKLEMELAPPRIRGRTHLITTGGPQSNHARVAAASAAKLGLGCILVINGRTAHPPRGNALLHRLFGAEIRTVSTREERTPAMEAAAREVREQGGEPLVIPLGASTPLGALGYARAAVELDRQLRSRGRLPSGGRTHIVLATSSCGTLGGLAAGFSLLDRRDVRLFGVSADVPRSTLLRDAGSLAIAAMGLLGSNAPVSEHLIDGTDDQVGQGYGLPTPASEHAMNVFARSEGVVLDPVYTAKAAAGFLRLIGDAEKVGPDDQVIFWHTGGHPALLAGPDGPENGR